MTEQELKDTIVEHIVRLNNVCRTKVVCKDCKYADYDRCTEYAIADALIAAGIGDVKSWKISDADKELSSINYYCEMREWKDKCKEAEHRADVAERALYNACCEQNKHWCVQCNSFAECDTSNEMCIEAKKHAEELIKQAEKELAEEGKDEQS